MGYDITGLSKLYSFHRMSIYKSPHFSLFYQFPSENIDTVLIKTDRE